MNKNLLRVSPSKWICKQYLLLIKYYSQCNFEWLPNLKDRLQEWKIALTSQCLTFFWVKTEINRNYYFQAKQQSTVSAAHQGMDQIPTVRWTHECFENNHDDNDENDDDDDGLPAYSHHDKIMMMKLFCWLISKSLTRSCETDIKSFKLNSWEYKHQQKMSFPRFSCK